MRVLFTIHILLFIFPFAQAQENKVKFGDVSEEELHLKAYFLDSSASAVVLSDVGFTRFKYNQNHGVQLEFTRHTRIKIISTSGYDWANVEVPLYRDGKDKEILSGLKGFTYTLENGKIEKERLRNESQFTEKFNENYDIFKFTMPAVKPGTVLEYEYTITSDFLYHLQAWEFQKSIPVVWSEYKVAIPEYFDYKQLMKGYHPLAFHEAGQEPGSFNLSYKTRSGGNGFSDASVQTNFKNESLRFTTFTDRWVAQDVPALVEEPYITTMDDYVSKISFELSSVKFPGETISNYSSSWENIDKELLDNDHFGDIINKKGGLKKQTEALLNGETDNMKKLVILYSCLNNQIRWNNEKRLFASQSSLKTLEDKSGNSADINLTLIAMLRSAGMEAYPVALSTRDHGMMIPSYPMLKQYNYVIAQVDIEGEKILLDATERNCPFNLLPVRCLNGMGRLIDQNITDKWIEVEKMQKSNSTKMIVVQASLNEMKQLEAKITHTSKDYTALKLRRQYYQEEEKRQADLEKENQGWKIKQYDTKQWEDMLLPAEETIDITSSEGIVEAGNLIYFNPILTDRLKENPFNLKNRTYPVDYAHSNKQLYMMNFIIPEGYVVEELPQAIAMTLPDNGAKFIYQVKQIGQMIQVMSKLEINKSRFYAEEYGNLREFYNQIVSKQAEQLVLRKLPKSE